MNYPDQLEIIPLTKPPFATVRVPGSKSITNRALVLAALFAQVRACRLTGVLDSEDTQVMIEALRTLGYTVDMKGDIATIKRARSERIIPATAADLFVGNSGTSMRFLTAMISLGKGRYRLDGVERMRERPIEDLLDTLRQLGVDAFSERKNGCPPIVVNADGLPGGKARIRGDISSQFLSGLLMATPWADGEIELELDGPLVSKPYVDMTIVMVRTFGGRIEQRSDSDFRTLGWSPSLGSTRYEIEPDASAASYFFGAAAICGGEIVIPGLSSESIQGDVAFVGALEEMGASGSRSASDITIRGGELRGIDVDMNAISDTVMTLAAVACFAEGPTTIRNVAHIRHKETDRIAALASELRKVGAKVEEYPDGLKITPGPLHGAVIETYNDHRMAMSMALIGLKVPGIIISNPGCVAKTYPNFFHDLEKLRA